MYEGKHYINGSFVEGQKDFSFEDINPATEEVIGKFPWAVQSEVEDAVISARKALPAWKKMSRIKRAELVAKLAELVKKNTSVLVQTISLEPGKSLNESFAEVNEAIHMAEYAAAQGRQPVGDVVASEIADKMTYTFRKPKGVVAIISPWNFSAAIGAFWCACPALVEGNTVVWKPSPETSIIAQQIVELYHDAGFPPGVINLVHGQEQTGADLVAADVNVILFTGSREVGKTIQIHGAKTNKVVSCELGSKSAVIVFKDCNEAIALDSAIASAFKLSGQRCVSSGRILIERSYYDEFCKKFVERASKITVGNPFDQPPPFCGPLISKPQQERVQAYNDMVRADKDCKVLLDAGRHAGKGYYVNPFVYQCEWADKKFLKEEVFGPHVALVPFDGVEDAVRIYNDTDYGLALGVVTENIRNQHYCVQNCDYGMIYLNGGSIAAESHNIFGGVKASGNGYKSAAGTWRAVTDEVTVTSNFSDALLFPQGMSK